MIWPAIVYVNFVYLASIRTRHQSNEIELFHGL